ncbi:MAG: ribosome silencing factor [Clostridia bacterium]|nr:ribosome silencing factor [Clostridia bacterium]
MAIKENVLKICKLLDEKKAEEIIAVYVADKTIIADWFIICSGRSNAHVKALCDELSEKFPEGMELRRTEGYQESRWVVLDFATVLVHVFHPEERKYYNLERLWTGTLDEVIDYSRMISGESLVLS